MEEVIYKNGNYIVKYNLANDNRHYRALRVGESLQADFPDSLDIKLTNKCSHSCPWCHESSNVDGKEFNMDNLRSVLGSLPNNTPIELAFGGGNLMEINQSKLFNLLDWTMKRGFLNRITINLRDVSKLINSPILKYVEAIGISIDRLLTTDEETLVLELIKGSRKRVVFHIISGIFPIDDLKTLFRRFPNLEELPYDKILVLGYKVWGRGLNYEKNISDLKVWEKTLKQEIYRHSKYLYRNLSFDNLAINQLNIDKSMLTTHWGDLYLGEEFTHSMYIDAVDEIFAPTSRDSNRVSWNDYCSDVVTYFKNNKNNA